MYWMNTNSNFDFSGDIINIIDVSDKLSFPILYIVWGFTISGPEIIFASPSHKAIIEYLDDPNVLVITENYIEDDEKRCQHQNKIIESVLKRICNHKNPDGSDALIPYNATPDTIICPICGSKFVAYTECM